MKNIRKILVAFMMIISLLGVSCTAQVENPSPSGNLEVNVIDVGQGDAIFIKTPNNKNILIDSGSKKDKDKLYSFLNEKEIKNINVLIGTHPHEDHIGNMASVIKDFNIEEVYLPRVAHTTKTFKDLIGAIKDKNLKVNEAKSGEVLDFDGVKMEFLAPNNTEYKDINNYSIVNKLTYGENSFLFMGDAEKLSEKEILEKGYNVEADLIKLGHHGSDTSTSKDFITKVNPKFAVVSCAKVNDYGHPHKEVISRLEKLKTNILRTYESGTITFISNGKDIVLNTQK